MDYKVDELMCFTDTIGHLIVGQYVREDDTDMVIKNPMYLAVIPVPDKDDSRRVTFHFETPQVVFRDFKADHNEDTFIHYKKAFMNLVEGFEFTELVRLRYFNNFSRIVAGQPTTVDANGNPIDVSKLKPSDNK